jgi:hypothetical protein
MMGARAQVSAEGKYLSYGLWIVVGKKKKRTLLATFCAKSKTETPPLTPAACDDSLALGESNGTTPISILYKLKVQLPFLFFYFHFSLLLIKNFVQPSCAVLQR